MRPQEDKRTWAIKTSWPGCLAKEILKTVCQVCKQGMKFLKDMTELYDFEKLEIRWQQKETMLKIYNMVVPLI